MKIENMVMVAVGVLLLAAVLVPVVNSVQYETVAEENEDADMLYSQASTLEIALGTGAITVNGESVTVSATTYLAVGDDFYFVASASTSFDYYGSDKVVTGLKAATVSAGAFTLTKASDSTTVSAATTSTNWFVPDDEGKFGIWAHATDDVMVNSSAPVKVFGSATVTTEDETASESSYTVAYIYKGTIGALVKGMAVESTGTEEVASAGMVVPAAQLVAGNGYVKFAHGTVTLNASIDDADYTGTVSPMVIASVEYTASEPVDNQYGQILGIVPIMVAVGLILACVSEFVVRKN